MKKNRREYDGSLFAWLGALIVRFMPFTGQPLDPKTINPYGDEKLSEEVQKKLASVKKFIADGYYREMQRKAAQAKQGKQKRKG